MTLRTEPRLTDPDGFYDALIEAHRGLDDTASRRLDARLVILLANHIGDQAVLLEAVAAARAAGAAASTCPSPDPAAPAEGG